MVRATIKAAFCTAGIALAAFGLSHTLLIGQVVEAPVGPLLKHLYLAGAPILFGIPIAAVAALGVAWAWRWTPRLRGWRFGACFALGLLPALVYTFAAWYTQMPPRAVLLVSQLLVVVGLGAWAGGWRGAVAMGIAALPLVGPVTGFVAGTEFEVYRYWVATLAFGTYHALALVVAGSVMEALETRFTQTLEKTVRVPVAVGVSE